MQSCLKDRTVVDKTFCEGLLDIKILFALFYFCFGCNIKDHFQRNSYCSGNMFSCVVLVFVCICKGVVSETAVLTPGTVDVTENRSVVLTCTLNVSGTGRIVSWQRSDNPGWAYMSLLDNGTCTSTSFLSVNESLYSKSCYGNKSYTLTILKADETLHDVKWKCRSGFSAISNEAIIKVKVPVKKVDITSPGSSVMTAEEHEFYSFTCKTSYSRPTPTVNWFLLFAGNTTRIEIDATNRDIVLSNVKKFESVTNVLNISLKREENGAELVCNGSNGIAEEISSRKIKMNVIYAPDGGPSILGLANGSTYNIKENTLGNLSCSISLANPLPHLSWNCSGVNVSSTTDKQAVKLKLQWRPKRDKDEICVCNSTHSIAGIQTAMVRINVLYPPDIPKISVSIDMGDKITATEMINITESETINLECFSKSRPKPSYTWFVNKTSSTGGNVFKLTNITRSDAGNYTCHVNNVMNTTFGTATPGNISSSMLLNILYPADVGSLYKTSLKEASTLNITCPVIPGNPSTTVVFWTRESDNRHWIGSQLIILNVTRADDTVYTCTVLNEMIPSVGNVTKTKKRSKFHLNVFYSAVIKTFSLIGEESKEYFVVNETENVSFICTVEANPASDITIVSPQREQIEMVPNINNVSHTLQNASYENAGEYICTGRNNYTYGDQPTSKLILIVRCPPRPSTDITNDGKIATALHVEVILQFTARSYLDVPDKTMFMWFKDNISVESDDRKFGISSNGLHSNLSIKNITQADFGQYKVRVSNSVGQYIHAYEVMAKDKPEAPKDFAYINDSITDSSVTLKWMPGFNGGYPQTFILLYKRITGQYWQNKSIKETGKKHINYTLSGLFSVMEYQVRTFARNEVGDSAYTEILQFRTKAPVKTSVESHSSSTIGIVAGSVSLCIVTVAIIIVVALIYIKRLKRKNEHNVRQTTRTAYETESSITYADLDVSKREGNTYSQLPATYEKLDNVTKEGNTYMEMENTKLKREEPDYINIRI